MFCVREVLCGVKFSCLPGLPEALGTASALHRHKWQYTGNPSTCETEQREQNSMSPPAISQVQGQIGLRETVSKGGQGFSCLSLQSLSTASSLASFLKGREKDGVRSHRVTAETWGEGGHTDSSACTEFSIMKHSLGRT